MTELSTKPGSSIKQHTNHTDQLKTGSAPLKQIGDQYKPWVIYRNSTTHVPPLSSVLTSLHRTIESGHDGNLNTGTLSERSVYCPRSFGAEAPYHKWPSSKVLQLKLTQPALPHTCSPNKPYNCKSLGSLGFWAIALPSSLPGLAIKRLQFLHWNF